LKSSCALLIIKQLQRALPGGAPQAHPLNGYQLERHFKKYYRSIIGNVNFFNKGGSDTLLDDIHQNDVPVFLVDLPAQSGVFFEKFVKEFDLFKSLKRDLKCNITLVSVISRTLDSVNLLDNLYNFCGDVPDYIVVKNLFFGETADKFERYNESPIRGTMQAIGMKEACLPELFYKTFDFLDKNSLTFDDIKNMENVRFSLKSRVAAWLNELSTELEIANSLLGLNNKPKVGYYLPIIKKSLEEWEEEQKKENLDEIKETPVA
jgi:hypothetical protein